MLYSDTYIQYGQKCIQNFNCWVYIFVLEYQGSSLHENIYLMTQPATIIIMVFNES